MAQNERIIKAQEAQAKADAQIQQEVQGISADIKYLKEQLPATGGMTEAEVEELATALESSAARSQAAADALKAINDETDSDGEDPETPEEPTDPEVPEEGEEEDENDEGAGAGASFVPA